MASGITATDECVTEYENFKLQNSSGNHFKKSFLLFRIKDEKIQLCESGIENLSWGQFVDSLTSDPKDGCYGIYDFKIETESGRKLEKLIFVSWTPDSGLSVKKKMVYASAREPFKQQLGGGLAYCIQATDHADLDYGTVFRMVLNGR